MRNVRLDLLVTRTAPPAPALSTPMTIWWLGERYRVRDGYGRGYAEIVGDVTEPRGFGLVPRTIGEFMDATASTPRGETDLWGDLASPDAMVREPSGREWEADSVDIARVAGQVFAPRFSTAPTARDSRLGRDAWEYRSFLEGRDNGVKFRSLVRTLVADGYVLMREVTDARGGPMSRLMEVTELDEGSVTEGDLRPS
ncbi:hypothetical protein Afil01_12110 [Actinorhabdospora filicis]|uniref:Uncharacterized protein n=1 Tax=Actinorhabdospora filicis TaxID=1785913 RepID=A0A9W6SIZ2_9ACTN|nr:hypothetical protein [Actinorhabdospora filicis]GLZ76404.1 hypothetical protein Afil01_12110 [Actinorhabdospora filicis]